MTEPQLAEENILFLGSPNEVTPEQHLQRAMYWLSEAEAIMLRVMEEGLTVYVDGTVRDAIASKMYTDLANLHLAAADAKQRGRDHKS
jgi:hypothetical protein